MQKDTESLKELLMQEHSGPHCSFISQLAFHHPNVCQQLVELTFANMEPLSRRAAWPLRKLYDTHPEKIEPYIDFFIENLNHIQSESVNRTILSILARHSIPSKYHGLLLDFCEKKILNASTSIASVANCLDIYYTIAANEAGLLNELEMMFEILEPTASAGIKSKIGIIRRKMKKARAKSGR